MNVLFAARGCAHVPSGGAIHRLDGSFMATVEQRFTFDEIGDLYDRYRPGYPEVLFEDLLSLSGISPSDRILEIGCGTGQATLPFAQRGYTMSCLEPGPRLASIARGNLADFSDIGVVCETFEAWPCESSAFGLVFSAQAFHWLLPELRFTKSAEALRLGGSLAVIGNAVVVNRTPHGDAGGSLRGRCRSSISMVVSLQHFGLSGSYGNPFGSSPPSG